ncbi:MAG: calcium-translocating P-type ATPase, PMCA-type [Candidatus Iainarchaeum archaeon]|uniref:P-type Ca(2+) transporter n=1 Tax=Candidatus Iainarchaeum sp. TaxID=3101447 RepID=A0A7T9I134_9ARCH|nr:MAG: calcium-translocating P-type ATPase, PMCA-type [Candidatus Diapherotrites archaeon]
MPEFYQQPIEEVLRGLKTTNNGLSSGEAERRLGIYGKNKITLEKKIDVLGMLIGQFTELLVLVLIAAGILSALFGDITDTIAIFAIVILNGILGFLQEYKAEKAIEALKKMGALKATVRRDGKLVEVEAENVVPGDVVVLEEGTKLPADIRFLEIVDAEVDEAILTGESHSVSKNLDVLLGTKAVADRKNMGFANTSIVRGRGIGVVVGTGMKTEFGKIAKSLEEIEDEDSPLKKQLEVLAKQLTIGVVGVIIILFILGFVIEQRPFVEMFLLAISLGVAAIPEGLPAITTITLALGIQQMAKRNALVKHLPSVETLGSTTVICSDKTGTLTKNEMTVEYVYADERLVQVTGVGYSSQGQLQWNNQPVVLNSDAYAGMELTIENGLYCNNADYNPKNESMVGDPTEGCMLVLAHKAQLQSTSKRVKEIPFTSERKRMSVVLQFSDRSFRVYSKGAIEKIMESCTYALEHGKRIPLTQVKKNQFLQQAEVLSKAAYRVLAFAYKDISNLEGEMENNLTLTGLMALRDPPREEVKQAIAVCQQAGITVKMVTGDNPITAQAIAQKLGMNGRVITGMELNTLSEQEFQQAAIHCTVFARVDPEHKYKIVQALQKTGEVVAVTGDGVNDAPALKKADIGIAMGIKGTDVAKEAADVVLKDDNFATLVNAVEQGRTIYQNLQGFVRYLLAANLGEVIIVSLGFFLKSGEILSPIQLLWINLVTDALPALALGEDPPSKDVMQRKPRDPHAGILNQMPSFIILAGVMSTIVTFAAYFYGLQTSAVYAQTMAFTGIVVFELMLVFNARQEGKSWLQLSPFNNIWLVIAVIASFGVQLLALYTPFLQGILQTVPLNIEDWFVIMGMSFVAATMLPYLNAAWLRFRNKEKHPTATHGIPSM